MPRLWAAPETAPQDRQEIVRLLLEKVTVDVQGDSAQVDVMLHWAGGVKSQHRVLRPVARYEQLSTYPRVLARIDTLRRDGVSFEQIAEHLNREGFSPPRRTDRFNGGTVAESMRPARPPSAGDGRWERPEATRILVDRYRPNVEHDACYGTQVATLRLDAPS